VIALSIGVVFEMATVSASALSACKVAGLSASSSVVGSSKRVSVSKAFGVRAGNARVSCSVEEDVKSFVKNVADAGKMATVALAASALAVSVSFISPYVFLLVFSEMSWGDSYSLLLFCGV
jgi:hypothetical protein